MPLQSLENILLLAEEIMLCSLELFDYRVLSNTNIYQESFVTAYQLIVVLQAHHLQKWYQKKIFSVLSTSITRQKNRATNKLE